MLPVLVADMTYCIFPLWTELSAKLYGLHLKQSATLNNLIFFNSSHYWLMIHFIRNLGSNRNQSCFYRHIWGKQFAFKKKNIIKDNRIKKDIDTARKTDILKYIL